jgi:hypothetical protein
MIEYKFILTVKAKMNENGERQQRTKTLAWQNEKSNENNSSKEMSTKPVLVGLTKPVSVGLTKPVVGSTSLVQRIDRTCLGLSVFAFCLFTLCYCIIYL